MSNPSPTGFSVFVREVGLRLVLSNILIPFQSTFEYSDEEIGIGKEVVLLRAEMKPIVISTMTKFNKAEVCM